ncbi:MAG: LacI family DNA-binding transcriptional regulator [bacterium]
MLRIIMEIGQTTIKDIAKMLDISPSTVSRALRNHPDISSETKKRVQILAEELEYHPNIIAQSLKSSKSNIIGVIVPEIKHHFFSSVISGVEEVTYDAGYTIMVCQSNESYEREVINTRALVSNRVDGLLVSISQTTQNSDHFTVLERRKIPFVFFDRVCEDIEASKVVVDDYDGAFQVVEHLIISGYRRIAHIAGPEHLSIGRDRFKGYYSALQKYNLQFEKDLVVYGGLNEENGILGFHKLLQLDRLPDAIFAVNDPVAIGAFTQIKENGLRIPDDIALAGFSDNPISTLIDPPLTTVAQPAYEIGKTAAKLLLEQIEFTQTRYTPKIEVLKTKLIIRKST